MKVAAILVLFAACVCAQFVDRTVNAGLRMEQQPFPIDNCVFNNCIPDSMTGGAAVADYNNDGYPDIVVTRLFNYDILFRNNHDGTFSDVSMSAGLSMSSNHRSNGVNWCDIDNDGDMDLYVTVLGSNAVTPNGNRFFLYVNNGDGTFSEQAISRGVAMNDGSPRYGTSATCGDYNGDGWLDLHVNQWDQDGTGITAVHTKLFRNTGNGFFEDVSSAQGFVNYASDSVREVNFSSTFVDMDKDGDQDLLVSGDFINSQWYENVNGRYVDVTAQSMCCFGDNDMGTAFGDLDKNGYLDWFITSVWGEARNTPEPKTGNRMYMNNGPSNVMTDRTDDTNTREADWGWGATFLDYDNDADLDLLNTNGQYYNLEFFVTDKTRFWENVNGNGMNMVERAAAVGITDNHIGKSAITLDYDNDGDLDIVISNTGAGLVFYENTLNNGNDWIKIQTPGTESNSMGIGAQINVWPRNGDLPLYQEMGVGGHYLGHGHNTVAHFGLGSGSDTVFRIEVYWPVSGQTAVRNNVRRNQMLVIEEPSNNGINNDDDDDSSNTSNSSNDSSSSASTLFVSGLVLLIVALVF